MRVCQFRHFGTGWSGAGALDGQQLLVLQRHPLVSNTLAACADAVF